MRPLLVRQVVPSQELKWMRMMESGVYLDFWRLAFDYVGMPWRGEL